MNREEIKDLIVSVIVNPENLTEVIDKIYLAIESEKAKLKVGDYVYTNNPKAPYITAGKRYKVLSLKNIAQYEAFEIEDDDGDRMRCLLENCKIGGNWIIDKK